MSAPHRFLNGIVAAAIGLTAMTASAMQDGGEIIVPQPQAIAQFLNEHPGADILMNHDGVSRIYGKSFAGGATPADAANSFLNDHANVLGIPASDLTPGNRVGVVEQPLMFDAASNSYEFTAVYRRHEAGGLRVGDSYLTVLVRNEPGYPVVLAVNSIKAIGAYQPDVPAQVNTAAGIQMAQRLVQALDTFTDPETIIWAGDGQPRVAYTFKGHGHDPFAGELRHERFVFDAHTNELLERENLIYHSDVDGQVTGNATPGLSPDTATNPPVPTGLHHAYVQGPTGTIVTLEDGEFVYDTGDPGNFVLTSILSGPFAEINNEQGSELVVSQPVESPGSTTILQNPSPSEITTAQVNGFLHTNIVYDYATAFNPSYPGLDSQLPVNVNLNNSCNAFFTTQGGPSINFYTSGSGCPNTAYSTVVYHEYGHYLIWRAGTNQGAYGEGMSDCIAIVVTDNPDLGMDFQGPGSGPLRSGENNIDYPCNGGIHFCGGVISGSVWDTRELLAVSQPDDHREILSSLVINSILLNPPGIDPGLTIDFLTLDDDDDDILNGTPHYTEINGGFSSHNLPGPELSLVTFEYANGVPSAVHPSGTTTIEFEVQSLTADPVDGSAMFFFDDGFGFEPVSLNQTGPNAYEAVIPSAECFSEVGFYFTVQAEGGMTVSSPADGAADPFTAIVATGSDVALLDNFDTNLGWTAGAPDDDASSGEWVRANPNGTSSGGQQVQPDAPFTGSACYITGQHPGGGAGANDVDNGKTTLFSPVFDLSSGDGGAATVSYWRWYSNSAGAGPNSDTFDVSISNDGGDTWVDVESVGPAGQGTSGGWFFRSWDVNSIVPATDQMQMRFVASDDDPQSLVEAAVDLFEAVSFQCEEGIPGDFNDDGIVDGADLAVMLGAWGPCGDPDNCPADLNGDGEVDGSDLALLLGNWTE